MVHKIQTYSGILYVDIPNVTLVSDSVKSISPVFYRDGEYFDYFPSKPQDHE